MPGHLLSPSVEIGVGLVLVPSLAYLAYRLRMLDRRGSVASLAIGLSVYFFGGWSWFLLLVFFISTAAIFTKWRYKEKTRYNAAEAKGGARGWRNVIANGLAPAVASVLFGATGSGHWFAFYLGSISAVTADTVATETGLASRTDPRLLTSPSRTVPRGTSGGVTVFGTTVAALTTLATGIVAVPAAWSFSPSLSMVLLIAVVAGMLGTLLDSWLGASLQAKYQCSVCGEITESDGHCSGGSALTSGVEFIDNDVVNIMSSVGAGALAVLLFVI